MGWIFESACENFQKHRDIWNELNRTCGNHILLDSLFVEPLVRHFGTSETLLAVSDDPAHSGIILVSKGRAGFWQTFQPSQAPLGLILLRNDKRVEDQMQKLIRSFPGHALGFSALQQDPDHTLFRDLNRSRKIETLEYIKTARVTLIGSFEDYWKRRSKNLTHNLNRQRRRLAEQGIQLELIVCRKPSQVEECLQDHSRLEQAGWKAMKGSAITEENRQAMLYREIFEGFCNRGQGVLYRLLMNGKTIASDLCLERDGIMVILKTAYDEGVEGISPGMLLHQEIFKVLFEEGKIKVVEFYGRLRDWHLKWTDEIRTMYHVSFYRLGWIPGARRLLKASSGLWRSAVKG